MYSAKDGKPIDGDYNIFEGFKLPHLKNFGYVNGPTLNEPNFDFDEETFENCPDNVNIDGLDSLRNTSSILKMKSERTLSLLMTSMDPVKSLQNSMMI